VRVDAILAIRASSFGCRAFRPGQERADICFFDVTIGAVPTTRKAGRPSGARKNELPYGTVTRARPGQRRALRSRPKSGGTAHPHPANPHNRLVDREPRRRQVGADGAVPGRPRRKNPLSIRRIQETPASFLTLARATPLTRPTKSWIKNPQGLNSGLRHQLQKSRSNVVPLLGRGERRPCPKGFRRAGAICSAFCPRGPEKHVDRNQRPATSLRLIRKADMDPRTALKATVPRMQEADGRWGPRLQGRARR